MLCSLQRIFGHRRKTADLDPRSRDVIQAAAMLEISEFEFMRIAHREWYGREAGQDNLMSYFAPYMFGAPPPFWAHRLAREVILLHETRRLDRSRFGINPAPPTTLREVAIGISQLIFLLVVLYAIFNALMNYTGHTIR